jgi:4-hydroxy-tetrahydrodipicolinate reductase
MKILIHGALGKMGKLILEEIDASNHQGILFDYQGDGFNIASSYEKISKVDVVIDFSHHLSTEPLIHYCLNHQIPLVIGTTGQNLLEEKMIVDASTQIPIFKASNFSYGVYVVNELLKKAALMFDESYDIEIIEKHHKYKVDSPSGTAKQFAKTIMETKNRDMMFSHHIDQKPRNKDEIGMLSLRGGNIVGEHSIIFAGLDDVIEIKHEALSKKMFAKGALRAAEFIVSQKQGLYGMDALSRKENDV